MGDIHERIRRAHVRDQSRTDVRRVYEAKSPLFKATKRCFDVAFSVVALVLLSPVMLVTAAAVWLEDGRPVFFSQQRMGRDMRPFTFYKFRSMHKGAQSELAGLMDANEQTGHAFKIENDPRVTRVGRFIRRYSIDELPQLLNVLKGDMSIVGPRPILDWQMLECDGYEQQRLVVRPGLTCYWQVAGRSRIPWEEWVELDLDYIEDMGIRTDLWILAHTLPAVFAGEGRY